MVLHADAKANQQGRAGRVRVRCYPVHAKMLMAEVAATFLQEVEQVSLVIEEASAVNQDEADRSLYAPLMRSIIDVAIGGGHQDAPGSGYLPLYRANVVAVSSRPEDETMGRQDGLTISELRRKPLLLLQPGAVSYRLLRDAGLFSEEMTNSRVTIRTTSPGAIMSYVRAGIGVAVLTEDLVRSWDSSSIGGAASVVTVSAPVVDTEGRPLSVDVGAHFVGTRGSAPAAVGKFIDVLERCAHQRYHDDSVPTGSWSHCQLCSPLAS